MAEQKTVSRIFRNGNMLNPKTKEFYKDGDKVELSESNAEIFAHCFEKQVSVADAADNAKAAK